MNCNHENCTYQEQERENNVEESYSCDDCSINLELPEQNEDEQE